MTEETAKKVRRVASLAVVVGILLYLSKFLRGYLLDNASALFVLGFLPNLGLAFTIPFIYVSNRVRLRRPLKHFGVACLVAFTLMILNEVRDQYQTGRVFDMLDLYASIAGVALAYLVYRMTLMNSTADGQIRQPQ